MANYYGTGRSNYIHVTDIEMVKKIGKLYECEVEESNLEDKGLCFLATNETGEFASNCFYTEEFKQVFPDHKVEDEDDFIYLPDFMKVICKYMVAGEVLVWEHVGNEKMRYVNAYAIAINSEGKMAHVQLDDIYKKASKLGDKISQAMY